jgi:hypothetical protein
VWCGQAEATLCAMTSSSAESMRKSAREQTFQSRSGPSRGHTNTHTTTAHMATSVLASVRPGVGVNILNFLLVSYIISKRGQRRNSRTHELLIRGGQRRNSRLHELLMTEDNERRNSAAHTTRITHGGQQLSSPAETRAARPKTYPKPNRRDRNRNRTHRHGANARQIDTKRPNNAAWTGPSGCPSVPSPSHREEAWP